MKMTWTTLPKDAEATHKKRLAQILRYISNMHRSSADVDRLSFVREPTANLDNDNTSYFHGVEDRILFTTDNFRRITSLNTESMFSPPPFSFYSSTNSPRKTDSHKRRLSGTIKETSKHRPCWLRLTRIGTQLPPSQKSPVLREYLQQWKLASNVSNIFTLERLSHAPKCPPSMSQSQRQEVKVFLRMYKAYLKKTYILQELEPLYNRLFDFLQSQDNDLVWGFGNAKQLLVDGTIVNGPLLEVLVEVELARDGALLVRPRQHTGVQLNTEVITALTRSTDVVTSWHRTVSELETYELAPGEPQMYSKLLKRLAVEVSPDGCFANEANVTRDLDPKKLVVTDDWCLFHRSRIGTVWARDASTLAEKVMAQPVSSLPLAAWSLTHGPGALDFIIQDSNRTENPRDLWLSIKSFFFGRNKIEYVVLPKSLLPLPTSATQTQIADLLASGIPAVVCEGPPGCGKSQTIANVVCAYLSQGKRVLVTSKGAPALSVLRHRLPSCVRELCVDVSTSESLGMRQLQQTVERLVDRLSGLNRDAQDDHCRVLQRSIETLESELRSIDAALEGLAQDRALFLNSEEGRLVLDLSISMMNATPWMMDTLRKVSMDEANTLAKRVSELFLEPSGIIARVTGFSYPISGDLISLVASRSGETLSFLRASAGKIISTVPVVGNVTGLKSRCARIDESIGDIRIDNKSPVTKSDWAMICSALRREQEIDNFIRSKLDPFLTMHGWPVEKVVYIDCGRRRIRKEFIVSMEKFAELKYLVWKCGLADNDARSTETIQFDLRRTLIASQLQSMSSELVEATIVTQLSLMFNVEAQRHLIRFAQVAARAKFGKSTQLSKLSQRQRRHRQEYLEAFERCVRYIPCWILTSSQISDYLPAEFGLFDLVVLDEASQSDITALPGILRGKQWLIVGDGKQVSPTEAFVSEEFIDSLRAAVPESPFEESLLPGCSFFDLCSQAYPNGRAVLREHFRCAPEIIAFSNNHFYNGRLVPLRLPTYRERLSPLLLDVKLEGVKVGKINEDECDKIVRMIEEQINVDIANGQSRSIGVISLVGEEQSRLIRGRLLDAIGPQNMSKHDILVGEPPSFQGAERDIVFLSMVCSPGRVPSQTQLMHAQRANVALSRARDRLVLVRSIDTNHVSNTQDIKIPIINFFTQQHDHTDVAGLCETKSSGIFYGQIASLIRNTLAREHFGHRPMGRIWSNAICVENSQSGSRAAVIVEGAGESLEEWKLMFQQQKSIERVGWKTLKVDALSFLLDNKGTIQQIKESLAAAGVEAAPVVREFAFDDVNRVFDEDDANDVIIVEPIIPPIEVVVISSDDESTNWSLTSPPRVPVKTDVDDDRIDPSSFGNVVELTFPRSAAQDELNVDNPLQQLSPVAKLANTADNNSYLGDQSDNDGNPRPVKRQRSRGYSRLDKYSRDGRIVPSHSHHDNDACFLDTDSDTELKYE